MVFAGILKHSDVGGDSKKTRGASQGAEVERQPSRACGLHCTVRFFNGLKFCRFRDNKTPLLESQIVKVAVCQIVIIVHAHKNAYKGRL